MNGLIFKYNITSPMEQFEITSLFSQKLLLPNTSFYFLVAMLFIFFITYFSTRIQNKLVPTTFSITHESLFRSLLLMVNNYMSTIYFPMIYTLFHVILFSNLIGMIPYSSTPTVEIMMTVSLAFTVQIGVLIQGFMSHKLYLLAAFIPNGTPLFQIPLMIPLEIISYLARTFSLGLRQAVNMITGHILVKVCISFIWVAYINGTSVIILIIPILLLILFLALELLIAYLQAYIFTFITCLTFKDMT